MGEYADTITSIPIHFYRMWFAHQIPDVTLLLTVSPTSHTGQTLWNIIRARSIASTTTESLGRARKNAGSHLAPHLWSPQQRYSRCLLQRRRNISSVVPPVGKPRLLNTWTIGSWCSGFTPAKPSPISVSFPSESPSMSTCLADQRHVRDVNGVALFVDQLRNRSSLYLAQTNMRRRCRFLQWPLEMDMSTTSPLSP